MITTTDNKVTIEERIFLRIVRPTIKKKNSLEDIINTIQKKTISQPRESLSQNHDEIIYGVSSLSSIIK